MAMSNSRRRFLKTTLAGTLATAAFTGTSIAGAEDKKTLRVIAYNVYECTGWPKERALGKKATALGQMPVRFAHELALYEPDIINFSESPKEPIVKQIAELLGMNYTYFPSGVKWPGAILSRFKITGSQNCPLVQGERPADLFTRHWGVATLQIAADHDLVIHSAHLHPDMEPATRLQEIPRMLESMEKDLSAGRSMLLMGDLNHTPDTKEYELWKKAGWQDTFTQAGAGEGLTIKSDTPDRRIDYILAAGPIAKTIKSSRPLFEGAFRVNNADAESFALSDHLPQLAIFE
ncbi:Endonuclease/exonuclease/phosphatase [Pirellula staleyi DSM 6068]|uniref:Endonuclease/exonuclease/phosphatase n=1 Tax=Pirellula staleyi (strain ATCC 27377 / DSM 6068 / ICPB 4128) TaxID=530564 RepID=D2R3X8_PIRSD|nr:endonuclease/exonuclease/phosphatase family protein [Pirellula staleyi]ADB18827.1 Endonuclease/exonuclease/phosphatase [Pirellula staleyi DSM 6068]